MANGISSVRPPGLQVSPVAQIGTEVDVTPGVQDFMQGFRSGFITVDDITKRAQDAVVRPSELELQQKQNEQGILDTETIRPAQRKLAEKKLEVDLANADLVASLARQQLEQQQREQVNKGIMTPTPEVVTGAAAAQTQQVTEATTAITGTPIEQGALANEQQNRATIKEFATVVGNVPQTIPSPGQPGVILTPDSPEYYTGLRTQIDAKKRQMGLEEAKLKAFPTIEAARIKAEADAPALAIEEGAKIKTAMGNDKELSTSILQEQAVNAAQAFATKPNPSNQDDIALIYETIKSFDPNAVREGELKLFQSGIGVPGQAEMFLNRLRGNKNAVLRPEERKNILSLGDTLKDSIYKSTLPGLRTYFERAVASGAPLKQVFTEPQLKRLIGGVTEAAPVTPATPGRNLAAPGRLGTPGYPKQLNGGYIFETQPDGTKINLGRAK